jgi:hypothetical protein
MAAILKKHTGTTPAKLSAVLGTSLKHFRQFTVYADPDNAAAAYLGPSTVTSVGANSVTKVKPGISISLGPQSDARPFIVDTDRLYVVAAAAESVYFIVNTDDGRR